MSLEVIISNRASKKVADRVSVFKTCSESNSFFWSWRSAWVYNTVPLATAEHWRCIFPKYAAAQARIASCGAWLWLPGRIELISQGDIILGLGALLLSWKAVKRLVMRWVVKTLSSSRLGAGTRGNSFPLAACVVLSAWISVRERPSMKTGKGLKPWHWSLSRAQRRHMGRCWSASISNGRCTVLYRVPNLMLFSLTAFHSGTATCFTAAAPTTDANHCVAACPRLRRGRLPGLRCRGRLSAENDIKLKVASAP